MKLIKKVILSLLMLSCAVANAGEANSLPSRYFVDNHGTVSFDVSMPIDATGYILRGENLKGGDIQFTGKGTYLAPLLAHETGSFELPTVTSLDNKPLIKTTIRYQAIKFINSSGLSNLFIKIGIANRTQKVFGLDPFVIKNGTYTWQVPIFSFGKESNDVNHKSENVQFMEVGGAGGDFPNAMYTQKFYLYMHGKGDTAIAVYPQQTTRQNQILAKAYSLNFECNARGIWGESDPYRTMKGQCKGYSTTFPAGPNLDYEYGTFNFPTVYTPWSATASDHCLLKGKRQPGCTNAKVDSSIHYMAQKIRVPINNKISIFAEFGSVYREMVPDNLRYQCKSNVYLKKLLPKSDCLKKSYLPGGWSAPYFAVGYEFQGKDGARYSARNIYIPGKENANRLAWRDASNTQIYAISVTSKNKARPSGEVIRNNFNAALDVIRKSPNVYNVIGKNFFVDILKNNNLYDKPKAS